MPEVEATLIGKIEGVDVALDGQHAIIKTLDAEGSERFFAIGRDNFLILVEALAIAHTRSCKILNEGDETISAYTATWWDIGEDTATKQVVLSLTFGAGGKLSFLLPGPMPGAILETLQVRLGQSIVPKPDKPLN